MKVLIRQARIIQPGSPYHRKVLDILVTDGKIAKIAEAIEADADTIISHSNLHLSLGFTDLFAHFSDPGQEQRETIESGTAAAAAGGFTDVLIIPNTQPAIASKSQVEYIRQRSASQVVNVHPLAAITKNVDGKELAEMYDMYNSGAVAFSDGLQPVQQAGLMLKALQYVQTVNGVIIQQPIDAAIGANGLMHEGLISTQLGLPGKPSIAESLMIQRDLELLRYTQSKLHLTGISTRKSVALIAAAKAEGLSVTCSVTPYHLHFTDADLQDYNTNLKVNPPLRTDDDRAALLDALNKGIIDTVASHHNPSNIDDKTCEFEYARYGMSGLETVFAAVNSVAASLDNTVSQLTIRSREIAGLPLPEIGEGSNACFTLFDPGSEFMLTKAHSHSRSVNNPFIGRKLKGSIIGILNKGVFKPNK